MPIAFGDVVTNQTNPDIADFIGSLIPRPGHDILALKPPTLFPFSAFPPKAPPLLEGQQKRNATRCRLGLVLMISTTRSLEPFSLISQPFLMGLV